MMTIDDFNPDATENIEELDEQADAFRALAEYCRLRGAAIILRRLGDINEAMRRESRMQTLYSRLPEGTRW